MFDSTGTRFDFTVTAGIEEVICIAISQEVEELSVAGATWQARWTKADGTTGTIGCQHGGDDNEVLLTVPAMDGGIYGWELMATDDNGEVMRVLYGSFTAVTSTAAEELVADAKSSTLRTVDVLVPAAVGAPMELRWRASSAAAAAAEAAQKSADEAAEVAEQLEALQETAQQAVDTAAEALEKLEGLDELLVKFQDALGSQIHIDSTTGTWIIAGVDSGVYAQGEAGKSPYISTSGTWVYYLDDSMQWVDSGLQAKGEDGLSPRVNALGNWEVYVDGEWTDTGIQAQGKDGLDGDKVIRIVVDSYSDIPQEGETCNGGYYYYVSTPSKLVIRITGDITEDTTLTIDGVEVDLSGVIPQETVTEVSSMKIDAGQDTATLSLSLASTSGHDTTPANQWLLGTLTINGTAVDLTSLCLAADQYQGDASADDETLVYTLMSGIASLIEAAGLGVGVTYTAASKTGSVTITGDALEVSYDEMDASDLPETAGYYAGWLALTTAEGAEGVDGLYDWYGVSNWAWAWLDGYFPSGTLKQITLRQDKWGTSATTATFNACYLQIWEMDDDVGEWVLLGTSNECYDTYTEGENLVYTFDGVTLDGNLHHIVRSSCEANLNLSWEYWILGTDADGNTLTADRMRSSMIAAPENCYTMQPNGTSTHACVPALDFVSVTKSFTTTTVTTESEDYGLLDGVQKDGIYTKYYAFDSIDSITAEELNSWLSGYYDSYGESVISTNIEGNTEYKVNGELVTQEDGSFRLRFVNRGAYGGSVVGIITALTDEEMKAAKLAWSLTDFWYPSATASVATEGWLLLAFETNEAGWYLVKSDTQTFVTGGEDIAVEADLASLGLTLASNLVYAVVCTTGGGGSTTNALPTLTATVETTVITEDVDTASQLDALAGAIAEAGIDGLTLAEQTDSELVYTSEYDAVTVVWTAGLHCLTYDKCWTVYAWLTNEDGEGSWQIIGERNDIATSEIYGLVKLGTDTTVSDGAPVGTNGDGQMAVPLMSYTVAGTAKASTAETMEEDTAGAIGMTEDGRARAQSARADRFGAMKHSLSDQTETDCVGLNADGTTGIRWATLTDSGVVRLGSKFGQLNRIPYQQGVGATEDHQISNNLLYGGALQHQKKAAWSGKMDWLDEMESTEYYNADDYYIGVYTSDQFTQSEGSGMELLSATTTMLAGVYIARGRDDDRENATLTAADTALYYYNKEEVYTKEETEAKIVELCYTRDEADEIFLTRTAAANTYLTKADAADLYIAQTAEWTGDVFLTEDEYNDLLAAGKTVSTIRYNILEE